MIRLLRWIWGEAWEKINLPEAYRKLKELGVKHGRRFFIAALIWEIIEDVVFPALSWRFGAPELIPVFLILHFEPVVYPVFFWMFRTYDRLKGREPWEPSRSAYSSHWRSAAKVLAFQIGSTGWLQDMLPWRALVAFIGLTSLFGFVHERIWHDTNYGITPDDHVQAKRVFAKTGTYLLFTSLVLLPLLRLSHVAEVWKAMALLQGLNGALYLGMEAIWAKSVWGVRSTASAPVTFADGLRSEAQICAHIDGLIANLKKVQYALAVEKDLRQAWTLAVVGSVGAEELISDLSARRKVDNPEAHSSSGDEPRDPPA